MGAEAASLDLSKLKPDFGGVEPKVAPRPRPVSAPEQEPETNSARFEPSFPGTGNEFGSL